MADITQVDLAIKAGLERAIISKWEQQAHSPRVFHLIVWAESLGYKVTLVKHDNPNV